MRQNENFYLGKQWEGVNAPDLDKPVFNVLGRVLSYFLATIVSDDVAAQVSLFDGKPDEGEQIALEVVSQQFAKIMEQDGTKAKNRLIVRNAAVDGDGFLYAWFCLLYTSKISRQFASSMSAENDDQDWTARTALYGLCKKLS